MIYTPAYIFSLIFLIILLSIFAYFTYNIIFHLSEYSAIKNKYTNIINDNYVIDNPYDIENIDSLNTKLINEFENKDKIIFEKNENKQLRDLLAFKYKVDSSRIDNVNHTIDIKNIDNPSDKALAVMRNKINASSLDPNYDNYESTIEKPNNHGLSVIKNITNPNYYLVNPLDKLDNKEIMNVNIGDDINLNKIIYDKVKTIVREELGRTEGSSNS